MCSTFARNVPKQEPGGSGAADFTTETPDARSPYIISSTPPAGLIAIVGPAEKAVAHPRYRPRPGGQGRETFVPPLAETGRLGLHPGPQWRPIIVDENYHFTADRAGHAVYRYKRFKLKILERKSDSFGGYPTAGGPVYTHTSNTPLSNAQKSEFGKAANAQVAYANDSKPDQYPASFN